MTHQQFVLEAGEWLLFGSDAECDVVVSQGLPLRAARLRWNKQADRLSVAIHPQAGETKIVDAMGSHESAEISPGQGFSIGGVSLRFLWQGRLEVDLPAGLARPLLAPSSPAAQSGKRPPSVDRAATQSIPMGGSLKTLILHRNEFMSLGSKPDCPLYVDTPGIPGYAARVRWDPYSQTLNVFRHRLADRGVFLKDGSGIHESTELQVNDWFDIAGTRFEWHGGDCLVVQETVRITDQIHAGQPQGSEEGGGLQARNLVIPIGERAPLGKPQKRLELTFSLPQHRLIALCAPSGTGKTTLLRAIISAKAEDHKNQLLLGSERLDTAGRNRQHVAAIVPQETILAPDVTFEHMLMDAYSLKRKSPGGQSEMRRTVEEALCETGLVEEFNEKRAHYMADFSGGQLKRISLALELMSVPDILLLDEPNSGLDPDSDAELMESISRIAAAGTTNTVIIATHSLTHLPADAHVLLLGNRDEYLREVAYCGPKDDMFAACKAGDDAQMMKHLKNGIWVRDA